VNPVPDPTRYPFRTVGKLFFVSGGKDWVGSASVIAPDGLMTVAHNLYDEKDGWSSNIHFVPAYTDGAAPFGHWRWHKCWIQEEWYRHNKDAHDFGIVRLDRGGTADRHVGDVVGWLGVRAEISVHQTWIDVGYPGAFHGGQRMVESTGPYRMRSSDGLVVSKQGWLGQGASGAPWLLDDDRGIANGVHSFSHEDYPDESFSPYFRHYD